MKRKVVNSGMENKSAFLMRIEDKEKRTILERRIEALETRDKKEKRQKDISTIVKEVVECPYVHLDTDCELTIGDMIVANASANAINGKNISFKEVNEIAKAAAGVTQESGTVNIIIKGQDLGD